MHISEGSDRTGQWYPGSEVVGQIGVRNYLHTFRNKFMAL